MSEPKKTAKELTADEQMEQRLLATYNALDSKEDLMKQLGMEGMETIIRSGRYNYSSWIDANAERGDQNEIIGLCRDHLRKVYGMNCKLVEVTGDKQLSHQLVVDKNGPLRVVPVFEGHERTCEAAARRKLESILNDEEYKMGEERDKLMSAILSKRYLDVTGSKEENQSKIIQFIVEEAQIGYNSIIYSQEGNSTERFLRTTIQGDFDFFWMG